MRCDLSTVGCSAAKRRRKMNFQNCPGRENLPGSSPWMTLKSRISQGKLQIVEGKDSIPGLKILMRLFFLLWVDNRFFPQNWVGETGFWLLSPLAFGKWKWVKSIFRFFTGPALFMLSFIGVSKNPKNVSLKGLFLKQQSISRPNFWMII